jgi:hypothetical protein
MPHTEFAKLLEEFNDLHKGAKAGTLSPAELSRYQAARAQLSKLFLAGQHVALQPGQRPRNSLRVARALPVDLDFGDGMVRVATVQLSSRGFAAVLSGARAEGGEAKVSLHIPAGPPLEARARVLGVKERSGKMVVSFRFVDLGEPEFERLEMYVFDGLLKQFEAP